MIHTIRLYIEKYRLLSEDRPVLVGLSGGADSVALLGVLVRLGYPCIALHCNFHLRGEESDRDEAFACEFAESLEVPFHKIDFDTISYAGEKHLSIEMAAVNCAMLGLRRCGSGWEGRRPPSPITGTIMWRRS